MTPDLSAALQNAVKASLTRKIEYIADKLPHNGDFAKRKLEKIDGVMIHHSATLQSKGFDAYDFAAWHIDPNGRMKAPRICYSYDISEDGTISQVNDLDQISWHAGNYDYNTRYIGVELTGNFDEEEPTKEQLESVVWLYSYLCNKLGKKLDLLGHKETPHPTKAGRFVATGCPGSNINMNELRKVLNV